MTKAYEAVVAAAEARETADASTTWRLADAILAYIPAERRGGDRRSSKAPRGGFDELLGELAIKLELDGISTPDGSPYTARSLENLRGTAMTWPPTLRFIEAAYRTHQEAGSPDSPGGKVLAALVNAVRGEPVERPGGVDDEAWSLALSQVGARKRGFAIAANDVRVALNRKTNVPGRPEDEVEYAEKLTAAIKSSPSIAAAAASALPDEVTEQAYRSIVDRRVAAIDRLPGGRTIPEVVEQQSRGSVGSWDKTRETKMRDVLVHVRRLILEMDQLVSQGDLSSDELRLRDAFMTALMECVAKSMEPQT